MRWSSGAPLFATALIGFGSASSAAGTTVVQDSETGFTFSEYSAAITTGSDVINFRIAIPSPATDNYDAVIQVISPTSVGWAGLAWGGQMVNCPLTVAWANGASAVVSSRRATSHTTPATNPAATLQLLSTGTKANGTHWQYTAVCAGCTTFAGSGGQVKTLNPAGANRLAFAFSRTRPSGSSPDAAITVHDVYNYWDHDFATAGNADFDALVQRNQ
ncbi:hypothetical protein F4809DRAFT_643663 [Biscogniauxia mediterranea]|nr:hypothetical protein F4809DRAFT_643663 [Biscogniauxia mediterranea]